ncbi:hypothetical protein Agub_g7300, partial [Astrephomene gubernaculifera]
MVKQLTHVSFMRLAAPSAPTASSSAAEGSAEIGDLPRDPRVVLLVNNLGATPPMEMAIVTREALRALRRDAHATVDRLYVGPYMTSLDMAGVSLTLLSYDLDPECKNFQTADAANAIGEQQPQSEGQHSWEELLGLLDAPTNAPGWLHKTSTCTAPPPAVPGPYNPESYGDLPAPLPLPPAGGDADVEVPPPPPAVMTHGSVLGRVLRAAAESLLAAAADLD